MAWITCAVLGYEHLLDVKISRTSTVQDVKKTLIASQPTAFPRCEPCDLKLFFGPKHQISMEIDMFCAGKLTPRMRSIMRGRSKSLTIDSSVEVMQQLSKHSRRPLPISVLAYANTPSSLKNVTSLALTDVFPSQVLEVVVVPGLNQERWFFDVHSEPFGVNAKPPTRVFVRVSFLTVFNELVRETWEAFADPSTSASRVLVVTGSPGIGKRWFFLYCVFCFLFDDNVTAFLPPFRLLVTSDHDSFLFDRVASQFVRVVDPQQLDALVNDPFVLRLVVADATRSPMYPDMQPPLPLTPFCGPTIYVANPRNGGLPGAELTPPPRRTWILPMWTLDELRVVSATVGEADRLSDEELSERYAYFGGNIDRVFDKDTYMRNADVGHALSACPLSTLLRLVRSRDGVAQREDLSEVLLHMVPDSSTEAGFHLAFASKQLARTIASRNAQEGHELMDAAVSVIDSDYDPRFEPVRQDLFEALCHRRLTVAYNTGAQLMCRAHAARQEDDRFILPIPKRVNVQDFETLVEVLRGSSSTQSGLVYYQPTLAPLKGPYCREVDAVVVDFDRRQAFLLTFTTQSRDVGSNSDAMARVEAAVARALDGKTYHSKLQLIAVMVVPPWLAEKTSAWRVAANQHKAKSLSMPWYIAPLDVSRW